MSSPSTDDPKRSVVQGSAVARSLAGPYHLGESSLLPEVYIGLGRASRLVLAKAAHILKLDRYRED